MSIKADPCLVRVATSKRELDARVATHEDIILFFPFEPAARNFIASWTSHHCHADVPVAVVDDTRQASTPDELAAVKEALHRYNAQNGDFPVYLVRRLPKDWEFRAWKGQP